MGEEKFNKIEKQKNDKEIESINKQIESLEKKLPTNPFEELSKTDKKINFDIEKLKKQRDLYTNNPNVFMKGGNVKSIKSDFKKRFSDFKKKENEQMKQLDIKDRTKINGLKGDIDIIKKRTPEQRKEAWFIKNTKKQKDSDTETSSEEDKLRKKLMTDPFTGEIVTPEIKNNNSVNDENTSSKYSQKELQERLRRLAEGGSRKNKNKKNKNKTLKNKKKQIFKKNIYNKKKQRTARNNKPIYSIKKRIQHMRKTKKNKKRNNTFKRRK